MWQTVKDMKSPYICGVELSGDPRTGQFMDYEPLLQEIRSAGFKVSLHCAEIEDQVAEADQMISFKPERLGHCCFLSPMQLDKVINEGIHVEVCTTSNLAVCTDAMNLVANLRHLKHLHSAQASFSINTDDTMLFSTNLSTEWFEYAKAFNLTCLQMRAQTLKAVDAAFCDEETKAWVRERVERFQ